MMQPTQRETGTDRPASGKRILEPGRVLVAMSGGVDSSVAAWLLAEQGLEIVGLTLRLMPPGSGESAQAGVSPASEERARQVCEMLGASHRVVDVSERFRRDVVGPFCDEYASGRTPNPCVRCNPLVKWRILLEEASRMGCSRVGTGHYARVAKGPVRHQILRGSDRGKDQSYALYGLSQEDLKGTVLPLGSWKKAEVRQMADRAGLPTRGVVESQDVCFIPKGGHEAFIVENVPVSPGPIEDLDGRVLGMHKGLGLYTVGQRRGLGVPHGERLYVLGKDASTNRLIVGPREALCRQTFLVEDVNWVSRECPDTGSSLPAEVEVRYRSSPIPGEIRVIAPDRVEVRLAPHGQAIAPGQSAVWYEGDLLLGGGVILG